MNGSCTFFKHIEKNLFIVMSNDKFKKINFYDIIEEGSGEGNAQVEK